MLFTVFHQVQDARYPFLRSNHDIFLISYFLTFYLIFLAHVMKKTLLIRRSYIPEANLSKTLAPRQKAQ